MKKILPTVIALSILVLPITVLAQNFEGIKEAPIVEDICCGSGSVVDQIINWLFVILLILAVLFILYAAITFITARGDPEKITTARNFVLYAIVGIIIGVLAKGIVFFVAETIK